MAIEWKQKDSSVIPNSVKSSILAKLISLSFLESKEKRKEKASQSMGVDYAKVKLLSTFV